MTTEIRITVDSSGQYQLQPLKSGKALKVYIPDILEEHGADLTYVFDDPHILKTVVQSLSSGKLSMGVGAILQNMQRVRLCIFKPLEEPETNDKQMTMISGDGTNRLLQTWQEALQSVPVGHHLCEIQFDLRFSRNIVLHEVAVFLKETRVSLQGKSAEPVTTVVVGCSDDERESLEKA